jgi:sugar phosphate isomerase/epimerase
MSKIKIGSPLFILRNECQKDLISVIEKIAELGFDGIEFLGFFGHKPVEIKRKLDSCGINALGNHVSFNEFSADTNRIIAENKEIGCKYITIGPNYDGFPGRCKYNDTLKVFESIGEAMNNAGMTLLYHNHAEELRNNLNGKSFLENIMDDVNPGLLSLEPDLGWIQIGGGDPMYYLNKYEKRCPVVHFKDFIFDLSGDKSFIFRPTGYGIVDYPMLYKKTQDFDKKPEWYVLDHDCSYERDIYFDLKISLDYFKNLIAVSV